MSPPVAMPALLKQTSIGPSRAVTSATIAFTEPSSPTSVLIAIPPTSVAMASQPSQSRSTTAMLAPAAANARHAAAPIPLAPPVTIATFPISSMRAPPSFQLVIEVQGVRAVVGNRDQPHSRDPRQLPGARAGRDEISAQRRLVPENGRDVEQREAALAAVDSSGDALQGHVPAPANAPSAPGVRVYSISTVLVPSIAPVNVFASSRPP